MGDRDEQKPTKAGSGATAISEPRANGVNGASLRAAGASFAASDLRRGMGVFGKAGVKETFVSFAHNRTAKKLVGERGNFTAGSLSRWVCMFSIAVRLAQWLPCRRTLVGMARPALVRRTARRGIMSEWRSPDQ
jgi:hypothetical protein